MGIKALEFWISLDEMREEGLPETFDYFRFQKGGKDFPFICVHTDAAFLEMLSLENIVWPEEIEFDAAAWKILYRMPGVYQRMPTDLCRDNEPIGSGKEAFLEHLGKMKCQNIDYALEEKDFRLLVSRDALQQNMHSFTYNENLDFSVLNLVAASNPDFPQKWNLNCLPGPLNEICSGNEGNEVIGVSTSMTYAGKRATYTGMHVEDLDYSSANIQFPCSAGKAWFAIQPEDLHILDDYVRKGFRAHCASPFLHKDLILDLDLLDCLGIRWYWFIQYPGDIILTNPAAPHQVVNLGYNLAESTNFYSLRHLVTARRRKACTCLPRVVQYENEAWSRLATFVYSGEFRFLCKINGIAVPEPQEILSQILKEAEDCNESFSSGQALANTKDAVTLADILQRFTQDILQKKPSEQNGEDGNTVTLPTARCEILSTSPLDLAALSQPSATVSLESSAVAVQEPRPSTPPRGAEEPPRPSSPPRGEQEPPRPSNPPRGEQEPPRPLTPPRGEDSPDLFGTPERTPSPRGRKRPPSPRLFEDPDAKAQRLNARADFFSQRRNYRGPPRIISSPESAATLSRPASPALSAASPRISPPASTPAPSTAATNPSCSTAPRRKDPRAAQADKIRKNTKEYKTKKESRQRARATYEEKNGKKPGVHKPASAWFKGYIQCATRRIKTAEGKIAAYANRVTVPSCDWTAKLQTATAIKSHLERRRFLYNVLQKMYQYCSEDLKERLDEGYLEQEIFRDFINFHSEANMDLLRATLESYDADFDHWDNVLKNEDAWNAEFGVDANYRIPCVEFSKLKFDVLDML